MEWLLEFRFMNNRICFRRNLFPRFLVNLTLTKISKTYANDIRNQHFFGLSADEYSIGNIESLEFCFHAKCIVVSCLIINKIEQDINEVYRKWYSVKTGNC